MNKKRKALILSICALLLSVTVVTGTLAMAFDWDEKVNTFTVGQVLIELDETLVEETGSFELPAAYEATCRLLERRGDITAVFAIADAMAVAAAKAMHDQGRNMPENCSMIAIDGLEMSSYFVPVLTTMAQPQTELGTTAVKTLVDMIEGKAGNRHILLPATLRTGGSVRPL